MVWGPRPGGKGGGGGGPGALYKRLAFRGYGGASGSSTNARVQFLVFEVPDDHINLTITSTDLADVDPFVWPDVGDNELWWLRNMAFYGASGGFVGNFYPAPIKDVSGHSRARGRTEAGTSSSSARVGSNQIIWAPTLDASIAFAKTTDDEMTVNMRNDAGGSGSNRTYYVYEIWK